MNCSIENTKKRMSFILRKFGWWIPDRVYLYMMYYVQMGKILHLKNPQTFSEKIQWLKLYNRKPEYTMMVDKYAVKEYVADIIGKQYIIPTIGIWDNPEDIEWNLLPDQFVLKTTHGGGNKGVVICKDKATFDKKEAINRLQKSLKQDIYRNFREWPYKNVRRRIIAEQFMENHGKPTNELTDYKFYCFNGTPKYCQVIKNRHENETIDFFDMEWRHQDFIGLNTTVKKNAATTPEKPLHFKEMKELSTKLSNGIPFSRIDLYEINNRTYFGEITFFPRSGFGSFRPDNYNKILGKMIILYGPGKIRD